MIEVGTWTGRPTDTEAFRSVNLAHSGFKRFRLEESVHLARTVINDSTLPDDWRKQFGTDAPSGYFGTAQFINLLAGLNGPSRIHLLWEVYQDNKKEISQQQKNPV